ncbi:MAG: AAA family ATPase [Polaromonas sp.]
MKISKLFLKAFGPFTNATLDFSGPAGLHLIYGPNEAGKSSALRAITDLRYGIPVRSKDDFVHEFKDMLLAGCFEDVAGRSVGLARRKGNKDPLMSADPATGAPLTGFPVSPEVLLALTGGVAREQFETMYGLNSSHLRKGGQMLIQGEGELGAALFEASTGSAGIKAMLQTLQTDAKKYFVPKGQLPILNEAARQLDDARQRYKQAVTKPDQWKALKRVHEEAKSRLAVVRDQLTGQRRRLAELTELRAVEPLLRELDLAEGQWAEVQCHVALPADTRERRLAALQQKARSQAALTEADEALGECRHALLALNIEPLLLTHAPAIDRLEADLSLVRRERDLRLKLQASTDDEAAQLMLQAQRMTQAGKTIESLDAFFSHTPSAAEQAEIERALEVFQALTLDLQHVQARLSVSGRKLAQLQREVIDEPAPQLQQTLSLALGQAQSLGDAEKRLAELSAGLNTEQRKLDRSLTDLGLESFGQLTVSRWLAAAEIDAYERERSEWRKQAALSESKREQLQTDLAAQQRRSKGLAASGEVVSADTLRHARARRDEDWQMIRTVFIDPKKRTDQALSGQMPGRALPDSPDLSEKFEHAQAQADRQADLLREGARRAAEVAECEQRIAEMRQALAALQTTQAAQAHSLSALDQHWHQTLSRLEIPAGTAATVREWLSLRQAALERHERLEQAKHAQALLAQQMAAASKHLLATLAALGHTLPDGLHALDALIALGTAADRDMVATRAAMQRRAIDMAGLAQEVQADQARAAELAHLLQARQGTLDEHCLHLYLGKGVVAETIKARLAELQRWVNDCQRHVGHLQQLKEMKASEAAAENSAHALGQLLQEPVWQHLDAWVDGLVQRLSQSREAAAMKVSLERSEAEEIKRQQRALSDLDGAVKMLEALAQQAGVQHADELPEAETHSERRRSVMARLEELKDQLARTSPKNAAILRAELADLDSVAIDLEKQTCSAGIERLESEEKVAIDVEQVARAALAQVDTSDEAAQAREEMEAAIARYRAGVRPWAQLKLAEALLGEALRRHREKAQGPVVALAGDYFRLMTGGRFIRLLVDADSDVPLLLAQPAQGKPMDISALSEGTADQLYLALRLAALQVQRKPERMMPLVLDDVLMTADDERAAHMLRALEKFSANAQVLVFTHHSHLLDIASRTVAQNGLRVHRLESAFERNQ